MALQLRNLNEKLTRHQKDWTKVIKTGDKLIKIHGILLKLQQKHEKTKGKTVKYVQSALINALEIAENRQKSRNKELLRSETRASQLNRQASSATGGVLFGMNSFNGDDISVGSRSQSSQSSRGPFMHTASFVNQQNPECVWNSNHLRLPQLSGQTRHDILRTEDQHTLLSNTHTKPSNTQKLPQDVSISMSKPMDVPKIASTK